MQSGLPVYLFRPQHSSPVGRRMVITRLKVKVKVVKVHTLDIAPLRSEPPPQKRSGMARVLKRSRSFTCTPTRSSAVRMSHTCLCLPSYNWYSFTDPGGMEGWVDLGAKKPRPRFEPATSQVQIHYPALYHTATSAQWLTPKTIAVESQSNGSRIVQRE